MSLATIKGQSEAGQWDDYELLCCCYFSCAILLAGTRNKGEILSFEVIHRGEYLLRALLSSLGING